MASACSKEKIFAIYLTLTELYKRFIDKNSEDSSSKPVCSLKWFSSVFHSLNISFQNPQADKCSICETHNAIGKHECGSECENFTLHKKEVKFRVMR